MNKSEIKINTDKLIKTVYLDLINMQVADSHSKVGLLTDTKITEVLKKTLPCKVGVQKVDGEKIHSKYGGILKMNTKANMIGHLNNIFHFKNRKECDYEKVVIDTYSLDGKKIRYRKHKYIDDKDPVYVAQQVKDNEDVNELITATEFLKLSSKSPIRQDTDESPMSKLK